MSNDLVKRLRDYQMWMAEGPSIGIDDIDGEETFGAAADRIEELEAKLEKAVDVLDWALICWDDHNEHGYTMQGDWVSDARTILAELKGTPK